VLLAAVVFIAGFAFLTVAAIGLSIIIVVLLAVGIVGALRNPPQ
jgi:hypothetical protein